MRVGNVAVLVYFVYLQNASTTGINHAIIRSKFEKRTALGSRASFSEENMTKRSSIAPIGEEKPSTGKNNYREKRY